MANTIYITPTVNHKGFDEDISKYYKMSYAYVKKVIIRELETDTKLELNMDQVLAVGMRLLSIYNQYLNCTKSGLPSICESLPSTENELDHAGYKCLGWLNGMTEEQVKEMNELIGDNKCRGGEIPYSCCHLTICDKAKVYYKTDSGD